MISVIMLTYNRQDRLKNMIEDVINQSYKNYEFIIIDNGSTDNTSAVLKKYEQIDDRIKVITVKKGSVGYARNIGVRNSVGEYIAFLDDDDRIEQDYLEFLYCLLVDSKADISICGTSEGNGVERRPQCIFEEKMVITGEEAVDYLLDRRYIRANTPAKMYKREILEKWPFLENFENEDIHTQYKYLLEANRIAMHGIDKYYFIRHNNNLSRFTSSPDKWTEKIMSDYLFAYRSRTEYIKMKSPDLYEHALYSEWSFYISMVEKISRYNLQDCMKIKARLIKELQENRDYFYTMKWIKPFEIDWMKQYVDI